MDMRDSFENWLKESRLLGGGNLDVLVTRPLAEKAWQAAWKARDAEIERMVEKWTHVQWAAGNENEAGWIEGLEYCAIELEELLTKDKE